MEETKHADETFNPDFSEYNPIMEEIACLKESLLKEKRSGFFRNIAKKLAYRVIIQLD